MPYYKINYQLKIITNTEKDRQQIQSQRPKNSFKAGVERIIPKNRYYMIIYKVSQHFEEENEEEKDKMKTKHGILSMYKLKIDEMRPSRYLKIEIKDQQTFKDLYTHGI